MSEPLYHLFMNNFDDKLAQSNTRKHFLPYRPFLDIFNELLGNFIIYICIKQCPTKLAQRFLNILRCYLSLSTKFLD